MKLYLGAVLCAVTIAFVTSSECCKKKWALLVAGSSGWENYGDQADVCHAYHTVKRHGVPAENIIVMIYNDVVTDPQNPYPGTLINRFNGSDVYKGVAIDYQRDDVSADNFLSVLSGNKNAMQGIGTGRVIESTKDDDIFIYSISHGGQGVLLFPNGDLLGVGQLTATLKNMYENRSYRRLMYYVEACYGGSMFEGQLQDAWNIYAETAANPYEGSAFCEYDQKLQTFVNSEFSYNWKVDIDTAKVGKETVHQEYVTVEEETELSHVMQYGNLGIGKLKLAEFFGSKEAPPVYYPPRPPCNSTWPRSFEGTPWKNDAALVLLQFRLASAKRPEEKAYLRKKIAVIEANREFVDVVVKGVVAMLTNDEVQAKQVLVGKRAKPLNSVCNRAIVSAFHEGCFNLGKNLYALKYTAALANLCEISNNDYLGVATGIRKACKELIAEMGLLKL